MYRGWSKRSFCPNQAAAHTSIANWKTGPSGSPNNSNTVNVTSGKPEEKCTHAKPYTSTTWQSVLPCLRNVLLILWRSKKVVSTFIPHWSRGDSRSNLCWGCATKISKFRIYFVHFLPNLISHFETSSISRSVKQHKIFKICYLVLETPHKIKRNLVLRYPSPKPQNPYPVGGHIPVQPISS